MEEEDDNMDYMDHQSDDLAPARGIFWATIISAAIYAILAGVWCSVH
jgi:hypothetical protein